MTAASTQAACSLQVLLARRSRAAVIYRRGPSRHTALMLWDRATDTFEIGQWFKGSVYPARGGLSPDGRHLLTFMGNFRPPFSTWTVLSRPPFYTALALWPKGDTWGGGGLFLDDKTFVLNHGDTSPPLAPGFSLPKGFVQLPSGLAAKERIERFVAQDPDAWRAIQEPKGGPAANRFIRKTASGQQVTQFWHADNPARSWRAEMRFALHHRRPSVIVTGMRWMDFDANDDLLFTVDGRLYRCAAPQVEAVANTDDLFGRARLLADFTSFGFEAVQAPYRSGFLGIDSDIPAEAAGTAGPGYAPRLDRVTKEDRRHRQREQRALRRREALRPDR